MKTRTWRVAHRYLGLIIGIQLLFWTASGLFFSWNSIKVVRGEHMMRIPAEVDLRDFHSLDISEILQTLDDESALTSAMLRPMLDKSVLELTIRNDNSQTFVLYDSVTGKKISPISEETAKSIALADFAEDVDVASVELIDAVSSHSEYRGKELPAYRVVLDHPSGTVIYVSANRGLVTTRRNNRWRMFDFFWMLHTMDYNGRDNFNHWLLRGISIFGLVTVLSGFGLGVKTSPWFQRKRRSKRVNSD